MNGLSAVFAYVLYSSTHTSVDYKSPSCSSGWSCCLFFYLPAFVLLYNVTHDVPLWWLDKRSGECTFYVHGFDIPSGKCSRGTRLRVTFLFEFWYLFSPTLHVPAIANRCARHSTPSCDRLDVSRVCFRSSFRIGAHAPYYKNWSWTLFDFQSLTR